MAHKVKSKKDARDYMTWGGFFADPVLEADIFATLPGWRQREVLLHRKATKQGREVTRAENQIAMHGYPTRGAGMSLSNDCSLWQLGHRNMFPPVGLGVRTKLEPFLANEVLLKNCTENGEGHMLLRSRAPLGIYAYICSLCLIRKGILSRIRLGEFFELDEGISEAIGERVIVAGEGGNELLNWLDDRAAWLYAETV